MMLVNWACPHCGAGNEDSLYETAAPICGDCLRSADWVDLGWKTTLPKWDFTYVLGRIEESNKLAQKLREWWGARDA